MAVEAEKIIFEHFTWVSGPAGATVYDMNTLSGDGTGVNPDPSIFGYAPSNRQAVDIKSVFIQIYDAAPTMALFGGIAALTNGCSFEIVDVNTSTTILDLAGGHVIKKNGDLPHLMSADMQWSGLASDVVLVKLALATPIRLMPNQRLQWTNQDDLTGLTEFHITVEGDIVAFN
jgi:hypothetical protein